MTHRPDMLSKQQQRGLGAIAAIVVLVILASIAAAVTRLGWVQQTSFGQDLQGARANQAANAGVEWGLYQALKSGGSWTACAGATQNIDLRTTIGFLVTVTCNSTVYNEGEASAGVAQTVRLYTIEAVACTSATACPDNAAANSVTYVERKRQAHATDN